MAVFIKTSNYYPKPGDWVRGQYGKRIVEGEVLEHPKKKGKAWIFSTWGGCVLCYIRSRSGRRMAINEIEYLGGRINEKV